MSIDLPSRGFTTSQFYLETNTQSFVSPLTKATQRMTLGGARWTASFSLPAMTRDQAAPWEAFFLLLEGMSNTFNGYHPDKINPRGGGGGTPVVDGDGQIGSSLAIRGCPPNAVFLKAGDMFNGGELKMATSDALADGSGNAVLNFKPALRTSPLDGSPIITIKPTCTMILPDDMQAQWECDKNGIYQPKTFTAFEVFS